MSRIGKQVIQIPSGVECTITGNEIGVKGPKGTLTQKLVNDISVKIDEQTCTVSPMNNSKRAKQMHGLYRQLIYNMTIGVSEGFSKKLQLIGVGYRAEKNNDGILFSLGYSMGIQYLIPEGIDITIEGQQDMLVVSGIKKQQVGQVSAEIRSLRKPEPYKGKGVRYVDEIVRKKVGKSGKK